MYAALHGYEKGLFSSCYSQPAKEMENGKNVSQFMLKCLGTTFLQYWTRWKDGRRKTILDPFFMSTHFYAFSDPPTHYVTQH